MARPTTPKQASMAARARHITHAHTMAETMDVITSEMVFRNSKAPPILRFTCQFYATLEVRLRVRHLSIQATWREGHTST